MKKQIPIVLASTMLLVSLFGVGCAKKSDNPPPPASVESTPPNPNDNSRGAAPGMNYQSGTTVDFVPDSMQILTAYVGSHPLNQPTRFKLNVNLSDVGGGKFAGVIQVSYFDNNSYYNGYFDAGSGTVQVSYRNKDTGKPTAEFNQWFVDTGTGKKVFHGFFQDNIGAVMLVIDDSLGLGDGGLPVEVSGSIWFKNFGPTYASQSSEKCWFIRTGPFDCRTFLNGSSDSKDSDVITSSALYPGDGYRKLGKFTGLNVKEAFNIQ